MAALAFPPILITDMMMDEQENENEENEDKEEPEDEDKTRMRMNTMTRMLKSCLAEWQIIF